MNAFLPPETTMTTAEAEAIVQRLAERTPEAGGPSIADVAEALRIPPEQVARLLAEVRANPTVAPRPPRVRSSSRERRVWLFSGALALVLLGGSLMTARTLHLGPFRITESPAHAVPYTDEYDIVLDGQEAGMAVDDGTMSAAELPTRVNGVIDAHEAMSRSPKPPTTTSDANLSLKAAQEGRWDGISGYTPSNFEIRRPDSMGHTMRWARAELPLYEGDDALVAELVRAERARRVERAIEEARAAGNAPTVASTAPASATR